MWRRSRSHILTQCDESSLDIGEATESIVWIWHDDGVREDCFGHLHSSGVP